MQGASQFDGLANHEAVSAGFRTSTEGQHGLSDGPFTDMLSNREFGKEALCCFLDGRQPANSAGEDDSLFLWVSPWCLS